MTTYTNVYTHTFAQFQGFLSCEALLKVKALVVQMWGPRLHTRGATGPAASARGGYLPPEFLQLPAGLQPGALHLLQPGPQLLGLLAHSHPRLREERQLLLLVLVGELQAGVGRRQRSAAATGPGKRQCADLHRRLFP